MNPLGQKTIVWYRSERFSSNTHETRISKGKIRARFWPLTQTVHAPARPRYLPAEYGLAVRHRFCGQPRADTPLMNYEVFRQTFAEQYAFFALRKMDWRAVDKKVRPQVTPDTKPEELFTILSSMVEPLHDKHIYINAPSIHKGFRG